MRVKGRIALVVAMLVVAALPAAAEADDTPWSIGAAKVDTTPPAFDATQDLQDFPEVDPARGMTCPRSLFSGQRLWRFEEPYQDTDGSGDFSYLDSGDPGETPVPEPFCDYNHNGRWEGIYLSGGANHQAKTLHDPIDARAVAFSDGSQTVVVVSVFAQGIFENYIREARTMAQALAGQGPHQATCGHIDEMVVSSNHNESSPDTVGIYGAPADPTGTFGLNSSIDEYYMDWLDEQMATVAVEACDDREPASLRGVEFPVPDDLEQEIPNRFPTATDSGAPAAIDPKVRVLQARDASGDPIFTMMNLADHNQDIGHSDDYDTNHAISGDWPGYFDNRLEQNVGGMAMFLAGDIGSMEDLITDPRIPDPPCYSGANGCFAQVELTGGRIADHVAASLSAAEPVPIGPVEGQRAEFCVPLENNLFRAAAAAGLFGERQAYTNCQPTGRTGDEVHTSVAVLDVGTDLQFIANPGEAFPGLMLGGPWGIEDASCPNRENPPVPTWHARAKYRFQAGLGDDLIGYLKPAWSFLYDTPGSFTPTDCTTDPHDHSHGLEDESVGWTASNMVATKLTELLDEKPDPAAEIRLGRYVEADGTLTDAYTAPLDQGAPGHFPTDAVAIWLAEPGSTTLDADPGDPDSGTLVALDSVGSFGDRPVDANGAFMDFDGAEQSGGPDVSTRGMLVEAAAGGVQNRYYVDVYPALTVSGSLGPANPPPMDHPAEASTLTTSLVPNLRQTINATQCAARGGAPSTHGAPLSALSCNAPGYVPGTRARLGPLGQASASLTVVPGDLVTQPDEADVAISLTASDVRAIAGGGDYAPNASGPDVVLVERWRLSDANNGGSGDTATTVDFDFPIGADCVGSADPARGSACSVATSADAAMPGAIVEGTDMVVQAFRVRVNDSGADGAPGDADDRAFAQQGIFVP